MSNEQELLCGVDSGTGQISYYFNPSTGEVKWINQPSKDMSKQIPTHVPSRTSSCCATEILEDNVTPFPDHRDHVQPKIEPTDECSNLISEELVIVVLEPCSDSDEKGGSTCSSSVIIESNREMANVTWTQDPTDTGSSVGVMGNGRRNIVKRKCQEQEPVLEKAELFQPEKNDLDDNKDWDKVQELENTNNTESGPCLLERGEILKKKRLLNRNCRSTSFSTEKEERTLDMLSFREMPIDNQGAASIFKQSKDCGTNNKSQCSSNNTATTVVQFESSINSHGGIHANDKVSQHKQRNTNSKSANLESSRLRIHSEEKRFKCKDCRLSFRDSDNLTKHIQIHSGEKPYKCQQCGKCFKQLGNLKMHVRIHTGEKPFKCKQCGKCFNQPSTLTNHVRIHSGEKPYKCKQCGECFRHSYGLTQHVRIHSGEKSYKCKQCTKCFRNYHGLTYHVRLHSGEKPYKCKQCEKCFTQSSNLTKHVQIHSGEDTNIEMQTV